MRVPQIVSLLGLPISSAFSWSSLVSGLASCVARKVGFQSHIRHFSIPVHFILPYEAQIRLALDYCSQIWKGVSSTILPDRIQEKVNRLADDPLLPFTSQPTVGRRFAINFLQTFWFCSSQLALAVSHSRWVLALFLNTIIKSPLRSICY